MSEASTEAPSTLVFPRLDPEEIEDDGTAPIPLRPAEEALGDVTPARPRRPVATRPRRPELPPAELPAQRPAIPLHRMSADVAARYLAVRSEISLRRITSRETVLRLQIDAAERRERRALRYGLLFSLCLAGGLTLCLLFGKDALAAAFSLGLACLVGVGVGAALLGGLGGPRGSAGLGPSDPRRR